nr:hypothetical protein CFP56_38352 [Quercus suber]
MGRKRQLRLVYVGEGSSHVRQQVEAADEEAHIFENARPVASDDETQVPDTDDYVQTSAPVQNPKPVQIPEPVQNPPPGNRPGRCGKTQLADIWAMTGEYKINLPLNAEGQPIEEDGSLFVWFLGSFCENGMLCPLTPAEWPKVPKKVKEDCWVEIEVRAVAAAKNAAQDGPEAAFAKRGYRVQRVSAELRSLRRQCPPSHPPCRSAPVPEAIGADGPRRFLATRRVDGRFRPGQDQAQRRSDSPAPVPLHQAIGLQRGRDPGLDPLRDQEDRERQDLASRSQALAHRLGFRLLLQLSLWIWV